MIQNKYTNQPISDYKAGKITKEQAVKKLSNIRRGGGGSSSSAVREAEARGAELARQDALRQAEILAQEAARQKAIVEKQIAEAKTQAEKTKLARAYIETKKGQSQYKNILDERAKLIRNGTREYTRTSTDTNTGAKLEVSQWRDKYGNRVERIKNLNTGEVSYKSFKKQNKGPVRQVGGVNFGGVEVNQETIIKNLKDNNLKPIVNNKGVVTGFSSNVTRKSYTYTDAGFKEYEKDSKSSGVLFQKILIEDRKTGQSTIKDNDPLMEAKSWFMNRKINNNLQIAKLNSAIKNLNSEGRISDALKLTMEKQKLNNELIGYTVGQRITETLMSAKEIPSIARMVYNDKSAIVPVGLAILSGLKADITDTWQLARVSPRQAIAKVGTDYFTFAIVGKVLKLTGKVTGKIARKLNPEWVRLSSKIFRIKVPKKALILFQKSTVLKSASKISKFALKKFKDTGVGKSTTKLEGRISSKVSSASRTLKSKKSAISKKISVAKRNVKLKNDLKLSLARAKKLRILANKKSKTVYIKGPDYKNAINILEDLSDAIAQVKTINFIKKHIDAGGEITIEQANLLIKAVKNKIRNELYKSEDFYKLKSLEKYSKAEAIKLIKIGKLKSIKIYISQLMKKLDKLPAIKYAKLYLEKIKRGIKYPVKRIRKTSKNIKKRVSKAKTNVKRKKEIKLSMSRAKKIRLMAKKKVTTISIGDRAYSTAVKFLEDFSDNFAEARIKIFLRRMERNGVKLSDTNSKIIIDSVKKALRKELERNQDFINLKKAASMNEPFTIKLIKNGKLKSAKILSNKILRKIKTSPISRYINSSIKKIRSTPGKVKKAIKTNRLKSIARKQYIKTNRYKLEKARPIREVTLDQLNRASDISKMNKLVDYLFDNLGRKQKLDVSSIKFKQMKNLIKKRLRRAIKRKDKVELDNFKTEVKKLIQDVNRKTSNPDVIIVEKVGKTKRFRTIKDFESESPKGTFKEVKSGNQVLLQRVESKTATPKTKQVLIQRARVVSVRKKLVSLKPLIRYGIKSFSASILKNMKMSKQGFYKISNTTQLLKSLKDSAQDFRILQSIASDVMPVSNITSAIIQDVNSKVSPKLRTKTKQIYEKEKTLKPKMLKSFSKKKLSNGKQVYSVITKKRGKIVRLYPKNLTLKDARDYLAYSVDNNLTKSAWFVPLGKTKKVITPPKNIQGYFAKASKKLRPYKIKYGKKKQLVNGYIEKRKYFQDTPGEKRQLKTLMAKAKPKRKITPTQRKVLLARLKKARAVRMRNLRRKKK